MLMCGTWATVYFKFCNECIFARLLKSNSLARSSVFESPDMTEGACDLCERGWCVDTSNGLVYSFSSVYEIRDSKMSDTCPKRCREFEQIGTLKMSHSDGVKTA
jgi:hypothetical protein